MPLRVPRCAPPRLECGHSLKGSTPPRLARPPCFSPRRALVKRACCAYRLVARLLRRESRRMTGCCVPQCTNHSRNGWKMFSFPRDPKRRLLWTVRIKRDKWQPTNASRVCSVSIASFVAVSHHLPFATSGAFGTISETAYMLLVTQSQNRLL